MNEKAERLAKRDTLRRLIEFHLDTIALLEADLASEQETVHSLMAEERATTDALEKVAV